MTSRRDPAQFTRGHTLLFLTSISPPQPRLYHSRYLVYLCVGVRGPVTRPAGLDMRCAALIAFFGWVGIRRIDPPGDPCRTVQLVQVGS